MIEHTTSVKAKSGRERRYTYRVGQKTYLAQIENLHPSTGEWRIVTPAPSADIREEVKKYKESRGLL